MPDNQLSIFGCQYQCVQAFENCIKALEHPIRAFNDHISITQVSEDYGRFKVWRGNVGALHPATRRLSLDFRLRDAAIYRDMIVSHLLDLSEALEAGEYTIVKLEQSKLMLE
jgi:hypothetical protein